MADRNVLDSPGNGGNLPGEEGGKSSVSPSPLSSTPSTSSLVKRDKSFSRRKVSFMAVVAGAAIYAFIYHQKFAAVGCGLAGLSIMALYKFQNRLLYFPDIPPGSRTTFIEPERYKKKNQFEEIYFKAADGVQIQSWLFKRPEPEMSDAVTILYFHGNAGNLSHRLENIRDFHRRLKANVMIVSYRGYGRSEGYAHEDGLKQDAKAALQYLMNRPDIRRDKIVVFGRSLGGAVAIYLASLRLEKNVPAAIVVENSFTSILDMIDEVFSIISFAKGLSTNIWDNRNTIKKVACPVLMLSGLQDELVPSWMMQELFENIPHKERKLVTFTHGHHMDVWTIRGYSDYILNFLLLHMSQT
eukprot:CAMPEP_0119126146 /NCGR_PEP_ID=MMETSP1310-20130426/5172_1 /TAXON_ID=464262 /ORGANISM="Genus nov. species nov., Strain RCC2339" /LENGTH=355 /DNA_ID=CAMNT_0007116283 /DNA_START=132 /DNA_END=1199 /DNA_ORIENTATION=-